MEPVDDRRRPGMECLYNNRGAGMVVANIDTGVQFNHPALVNQYRGNLGGGSFDHTNNWYDPANICGGAPCDNVGHGSHTMGTMVGDDGAGNQVGVAPGAKWIACKGCESGSCSGGSLISCAQWILAPGGNSSLRPNVVNNSWGGGSGSNWYQSYVQSWVAAGIFPAFSAGNSGSACSTANDPGDYPESFASGATDSGDNIASFSSRGPSLFGGVKPNVSAPGVNITPAFLPTLTHTIPEPPWRARIRPARWPCSGPSEVILSAIFRLPRRYWRTTRPCIHHYRDLRRTGSRRQSEQHLWLRPHRRRARWTRAAR